jgi:hypothetical protein
MSVNKIGNTNNNIMTIVAESQTAPKMQSKAQQEATRGDIVSIGKSKAINTTQVKYPPLLPIGHTQGIYELDE